MPRVTTKTWRLYGRRGRLAATFKAGSRADAEGTARALLVDHNWKADHDRKCTPDTCDWWGLSAYYGFLAAGRQEYWSAVMAESVGDDDSDYGAETVWRVHPDCIGHRHLSAEEARACRPNADGYMRRVGRTLVYER